MVDLGVDYGYSAFAFALPDIGTVYGIDCRPHEGPTAVLVDVDPMRRERRDRLTYADHLTG